MCKRCKQWIVERRWFFLLILPLCAAGMLAKGMGLRASVVKMMKAELEPSRYEIQVTSVRPIDGAFEIPTDATITADLKLPNGGVDASTVNSQTVMLVRARDQKQVAATVKLIDNNTISLRPQQPLDKGTTYVLFITSAIEHRSGASVVPWSTSFTTVNEPDATIKFDKLMQPAATGTGFTCVRVGPDAKLWASSDDGRIFRFPIEENGNLGMPEICDALQRYNGGPRLVSGFAFDRSSSPLYPVVWVNNCAYTFNNAPDFSGKVTRMAGPKLEDVGDVVVHLPRSVRDHMTNQPDVGPDGALYFPQGSSSSYGAADEIWGMRDEHLLTATILRLDVTKVTVGEPIDALTPESGGTYDPRSNDAPLKIYATGIRNAWHCLWHSNGRLYVPTNGSSAGGHAPAGDGAPPIRNLTTAEDDWLFRIAPGKFHGHPNPTQGHFVLNGGNPTAAYDFAEAIQYPVGTRPDANYAPPVYSFGKHVSANGVIEYMSNTFGGKLKHRLLVCRYNVGSDIMALTLDGAGNVVGDQFGFAGTTGLVNPLDITEDRRNGNLYVSEFGALRITLLRPAK